MLEFDNGKDVGILYVIKYIVIMNNLIIASYIPKLKSHYLYCGENTVNRQYLMHIVYLCMH